MTCASKSSVTRNFGRMRFGTQAITTDFSHFTGQASTSLFFFYDFKCGRLIIHLFSDLIANKGFFIPASALPVFFFNGNNDYPSRQLIMRLSPFPALVGWNGGFNECFWCLLGEWAVV